MIATQVASQSAPACVRRVGAARVRSFVAQRLPGPATDRARRYQNSRIIAYAAEEATASAPASASPADGEAASNGSKAEDTLSPIQAARQALDREDIDRVGLEQALGDLDAELSRLGQATASAEAKAAQLESAVATAKDQFIRLTADFDNFRRRTQAEKEALADNVRGDVIEQLLPLIDNFELARTNVKAETENEVKINNSYQGLYKQMVDIMRGLGIEAVPTQGTLFDPSIHDAIMREPNDDVPDGTVLQEFRKGFKIGDKLIRPAMVKVSSSENSVAVQSSEE